MPSALSFYFLANQIYYNSKGPVLDHPDLWRKVVPRVFTNLGYENKVELFDHTYGVERGRLVHHPENDSWTLYGTPGCEAIEKELISHFKLTDTKFKTDFHSDPHYKTRSSQVKAVEHAMKLAKVVPSPQLLFIQID